MSFLQGFNYSFGPNLGNGGFGQAAFAAPNRFAPQQIQQYTNNPSPTNLPLPESIVQNPQSYIDYYGNPTHPPSNGNVNNDIGQNPNGFYENPQNYQQQQDYNNQQQPQPQIQPQPQQQGRKRRPKNSRTRNAAPAPPALNYGPEHIQQFQDFQNFNSLPIPQRNSQHQQQQQNSQQQPQPQQSQQQHPAGTSNLLRVTPIQGPIFAKDGFVPVVPLYSYPHVKNGTFYQIPILWTALSYALGLEIRGEILRGLPCIKRLNQLFCPTAGNTYPLNNIERFIDENKALIKRMYGEFIMSSDAFAGPLGGNALRRSTREIYEDEVSDLFDKKPASKHTANADTIVKDDGHFGNGTENGGGAHIRTARQTVNPKNGGPTQQPKSNRVDSCESTTEIVTPYWAANSAGKVRAIVNTQHFEQAIHQEVCAKTSTKRCTGDCGCEQKYKWHRLLAYDPDNDCRGIFMDWFLFPSCCVCRCNPLA